MTTQDTKARGDYAELWRHLEWSYPIISTKDYAVFIDKDGDLDWETTPEYDERIEHDQHYDLSQHNAVHADAALLEATPCGGLSMEVTRHFRRMIGQALGFSFDCDYAGARKGLSAARRFLRARSEETSRKWYLSSSFVVAAPFVVSGIIVWFLRLVIAGAVGWETLWLLMSASLGALGALFSVITRTGHLRVDCSAGFTLHLLESASRIFAGATAGLLVALAVKCELLLALIHHQALHPAMMVAALAAGAGERLAPSIISTFESAHIRVAELSDASSVRVPRIV